MDLKFIIFFVGVEKTSWSREEYYVHFLFLDLTMFLFAWHLWDFHGTTAMNVDNRYETHIIAFLFLHIFFDTFPSAKWRVVSHLRNW